MRLSDVRLLDGAWADVLDLVQGMNLDEIRFRGTFDQVDVFVGERFRWHDVLVMKGSGIWIGISGGPSWTSDRVKLQTHHRLARILIGPGPTEDGIAQCFDYLLGGGWKIGGMESEDSNGVVKRRLVVSSSA